MSDTTSVDRPAGQRVLDGKADDIVDSIGLKTVKFTVIPDTFRDKLAISPATPLQVDRDTRLTLTDGQYFARLDRTDNGPYQVTALVGQEGTDPGEYNVADLQQAGANYPAEIRAHYLAVDPAIMGPNARALQGKIVAAATAAVGGQTPTPIDYTEAIMKELRSNTYHYSTDVRDLHCEGLSTVECFAKFKQGFCQYYAPTMAVILRSLGVPTRIVEGFLPGERSGNNEVLRNNNAHAWVEVYFPGYNWVTFDPTGAGIPAQAPATLPAGNPSASRSPRPSSSGGPLPTIPGIGQERDPGGSGPAGPTSGRTSLGPLIAVGVLLLAVVLVLAFLAWRRGPRGATTADSAYGMVTRMAARLGFGPRPNQTVYEYAGVLGEVLPDVRPELQTVAHAKVESVYAREILSSERIDRLRDAQRRLRMSLLRLAFRRQERKQRRRR
jgi:transglutaminase-like putative cysteine protease